MRRHDWPERLSEVLNGAAGRPFRWGEHDCALHAADAVFAMTGVDPAAEFRGRYSTERGAARVLAKASFASLEVLADSKFKRVSPVLAWRGDLALVEQPKPTLAVVDGRHLSGPEGVVLPMRAALACWRVE